MDGISMTEAELDSLREELNELESAGRAEIAARIKTAREWGDLKENGEYHAAKEAQAHLETRIARLREQMRAAVIVQAGGTDQVQHGSTVRGHGSGDPVGAALQDRLPPRGRPQAGHVVGDLARSAGADRTRARRRGRDRDPGWDRRLRIESIA